MIVHEIPAEISLPEPLTPRSAGIHVSGIIRAIATEAGILKPEVAEEVSLVDARSITDPIAILRISLGLAWEEYYLPKVPGLVDHPGEMKVDGVYMTHDGESLDVVTTEHTQRYETVCHECKLTWKSTKTVGDLSNQFMWLCQIKAYCKGLNTRFAKLHVYFVCGDYTYPIRPQLRVWLIEFTEEEISGNWDMLIDYRDVFVQGQ